MKKILVIISIAILLGAFSAIGYWYWSVQRDTIGSFLTAVALDNPDIDSFDDVCTNKTDYELECSGNIEQFECDRYRLHPRTDFLALKPFYPIMLCDKRNITDEGVYQTEGEGWTFGTTMATDYVILKDGLFQLIQSKEQLSQVFEPIESTEEAKDYFNTLNQGWLVLDEETLKRIKTPKIFGNEPKGDRFAVSVDSIVLNNITDSADGYIITSYSTVPGPCVDEVYLYTFLLKTDGQLIEQDKQLIWEMINKPSCLY